MAKKDPTPPPPSTQPAPLSKRARGFGWKVDAHDARDYALRPMLGAPVNLPGEAMGLLGALRGVRDQGGSSSCVAHAFGTAVDTRLRHKDYAPPDCSRLALYAATRGYEKAAPGDPLVDVGAYPRDCARALREYGIADEALWPFDEGKINAQPPWDVAQQASAFRVSAYYRVTTGGAGRGDDVAHALAQGFPVVFGAEVGRAFEDYGGQGLAQLPASPADALGGHMLCLLGYTTVNGERRFRGVNSWGTSWGDRGLFWMAESSLVMPAVSDLYALEVVGG